MWLEEKFWKTFYNYYLYYTQVWHRNSRPSRSCWGFWLRFNNYDRIIWQNSRKMTPYLTSDQIKVCEVWPITYLLSFNSLRPIYLCRYKGVSPECAHQSEREQTEVATFWQYMSTRHKNHCCKSPFQTNLSFFSSN